jgi:TetR/AcrR family transcriptional regulator, cholesterol catabolism regulator
MAVRERAEKAEKAQLQGAGEGRTAPITREAVLEVAAVLFMNHGYERTTLAHIADRLHISAPSLYWHFQSKEEVLYEFLKAEWLSFLARVEEAAREGTPAERLRALASAHVRHGLERRTESRAFIYHYGQLAHLVNEERRTELHELNQRFVRFCRAIIDDGIRSGAFVVPNLVATSFAIMNACEAVIGWFDADGSLSIEDVAELHGEYALRIAGVDLAVRPAVARFIEKAPAGGCPAADDPVSRPTE